MERSVKLLSRILTHKRKLSMYLGKRPRLSETRLVTDRDKGSQLSGGTQRALTVTTANV